MFCEKLRSRRLAVLSLIAILSLCACSSSKNRVGGVLNLDTDLKLSFHAGDDINPDQNNRASPVIIRLYELSSTSVFDKADFVDLYERDAELLRNGLIAKQTFQPMVPGERREERLVLNPGTTHVALYAEFSRYQGSSYKLLVPVTQNNVFRTAVAVQISGNHIALIP